MPDLREVEVGTTVITAVPVADVLEKPEEGVPRTTQLLMGWPAQVLGMEADWLHIQAADGSPGWAKMDHFSLPPWPEQVSQIKIRRATADLYLIPGVTAKKLCTLFLGSQLYLLEQREEYLKVVVPRGGTAFVHKEDVKILESNQLTKQKEGVLAAAGLFIGSPYLWGGMTVQGIDCSGLTYMAYFANGYQLPRNAEDQFKVGKPVDKADLQTGDLVFFSTVDPGPSHVGIYQGDGLFLNARTKQGVTTTSLDDDFFACRYLGARRYFDF